MNNTNKPDTYERITAAVIAALEAGTVPWRKPWSSAGLPRNYDGRPYRGINAFLLALAPYPVPVFVTYRRAAELGGHVKKGEHGLPVIFWKVDAEKETAPDGTEETRRWILARTYHVFNVEQTEGIPPEKLPQLETHTHPDIDAAAALAAGMPRPPTLTHKAGRAFYRPSEDAVSLPPPEHFTSRAEYYSTLYHELGHATGHASRLARKGITEAAAFGSDPYATEELVAEMTAAFLCAQVHIEPATLDNSAAYVAGWLKTLRADKRAVIVAAAQAQKAADYILNRNPAQEAQP